MRDWHRDGLVYYIWRDGEIKIGTSFQGAIAHRLARLEREGGRHFLLAVHGGGYEIEGTMIARFHSDHLHGEWFRTSPELMEHIRLIRQIVPVSWWFSRLGIPAHRETSDEAIAEMLVHADLAH